MDIIERAADLLSPFMGEDRRDTWLTLAFHAEHRQVYDAISQRGATKDFVVRCVRGLLEHGALGSRHALSLLLENVRAEAGADKQAAFGELIEELDQRCLAVAEQAASSSAASSAQRSGSKHGPVLFVSYSRADRVLADRLVADLEHAGHSCWLDTSDIPGGEVWLAAIADGIERAYAFLSLVSTAANSSEWVRVEYLHAKKRGKPIVPLLAEDCEPPWYMADRQAIPVCDADYTEGLQRLLRSLPATPTAKPVSVGTQREAELIYLRRLEVGELVHTQLYTPMSGVAKVVARGKPVAAVPSVVMRPEFRHLSRLAGDPAEARSESRPYGDIAQAFARVPRAVLLGEPGAGKTTTLWKIARDALAAALADEMAPIPLLVALGKWTDADESLRSFLERQLGELGVHFDSLLEANRAVLLLDGLNEVPAGERTAKAIEVKAFLEKHAELAAVVSCRKLDYTGKMVLDIDIITINPLDPPRILDFVTGYLTAALESTEGGPAAREAAGRDSGEDLFWRLAGGKAVREAWQAWRSAGASLALFWSATDIPRANPDIYSRTTAAMDEAWRQAVRDPRSLMRLAGNPYLLYMLTLVYLDSGKLPANRALLFDRFVEVLLLREKLAEVTDDGDLRVTAEGVRLLDGLDGVAWTMQSRHGKAAGKEVDKNSDAATALERSEATKLLDDPLLHRAAAASLLDVGEREVRFIHQLLQEYFTARGMRARLAIGDLRASQLWPTEHWWQRTGWEESAVLLAGFHAADCTPVVEWLLQAQPEVAAQCILGSGAMVPDETLVQLREAWRPRLTDLAGDPAPEARAAVGRALGGLSLRGLPLDNRHGVGLRVDAEDQRRVPDIDWVDIPTGEFRYGEEKTTIELSAFRIARFPITTCQFQCFIDERGYQREEWWQGLAKQPTPRPPMWSYANHPRETVSWYEAMAFCRWLEARLRERGELPEGGQVRLPSEREWEKAARGSDGREFPWGEFQPGHANMDEQWDGVGPYNLAQTSAVGIYPQGASPYEVLELAGNVWEWCADKFDEPGDIDPGGKGRRVVSGGSWGGSRDSARCACRDADGPRDRYHDLGFRVVCVSPIR